MAAVSPEIMSEVPLLFICPCVNQDLIIQIHKLMEIKKNKELYDAPSTRVFEVKIEGVICQSGPLNNEGAAFDDYQDGIFTW